MTKFGSYCLGLLTGLMWFVYLAVIVALLTSSTIARDGSEMILIGFLTFVVLAGTILLEKAATFEEPRERRNKVKTKLRVDHQEFASTNPVDYLPEPTCPHCNLNQKHCVCGAPSTMINHYWEYMKCKKKLAKLELYGDSGIDEYEELVAKAEGHYNELSAEDKDKADDAAQNLWKMAEE
jgi:hypothetical protein